MSPLMKAIQEAATIYEVVESLKNSPLCIGDSKSSTTHAFLGDGIGDFLALESHLPARTRLTLERVYYGRRSSRAIRDLFDACPFPAVQHHEPLCTGETEWFTLPQACAGLDRPQLLGRVEDWSIFREFPRIAAGELGFSGSSFLRHTLADISHLRLPARFIAIHPASVNDEREQRDFTDRDWAWLLGHLERLGLAGVILGTGDRPRPTDERLIDLTNGTSYPEAVEVLKAACGFVGIASSLSVLAAQLFQPPHLIIRGPGRHVRDNRRLYYAPHRECYFVRPSLTYDTLDSYTWREIDGDLSRANEREIVRQTRPPRLDLPVKWILVMGCWGDLLCQLGYARHLRETTGQRIAVAVYWYDFHEDFEEFLAAQTDLTDFRVIRPPSRIFYHLLHSHWFGLKNRLRPKGEWVPIALDGVQGIAEEDVDFLPLLSDDSLDSPVYHYRGLDLPKASREWAKQTVEALRSAHPGRKLVLLHPYSFNSTDEDLHWPHWQAAVEWIATQPDTLGVLTGLKMPVDWSTPEGVVDLVGKTASTNDLLALAELSDGIVSTTNSLGLWSVVADRPAIVCTNRPMMDRQYYFRRWYEAPQNRIVEWREGLEEFKQAWAEKSPEFGRPPSPAPYRAPAYNRHYFERYVGYDGSPMADALNDARVELVRRHAPSNSAVLDIGIGSGRFMREWSDAGGKAYGFDVNPVARGWLEESGQWADPFAVLPPDVGCVTLWDVLEHLAEPGELLGRLPEGVVVCGSIPIFEDLSPAAIRASKHMRPDEHLVYFSKRGLIDYMADQGLVLLETNDAETQAGRDSILSFAFRKDWAAAREWKAAHAPPLSIEEKRAALTDEQRDSLLHCSHRKQRAGSCCGQTEEYCELGHFGGKSITLTTHCVECVAEEMAR